MLPWRWAHGGQGGWQAEPLGSQGRGNVGEEEGLGLLWRSERHTAQLAATSEAGSCAPNPPASDGRKWLKGRCEPIRGMGRSGARPCTMGPLVQHVFATGRLVAKAATVHEFHADFMSVKGQGRICAQGRCSGAAAASPPANRQRCAGWPADGCPDTLPGLEKDRRASHSTNYILAAAGPHHLLRPELASHRLLPPVTAGSAS